MRRCVIPLEDISVSGDVMDRGQQLFGQQHIAVLRTVHFDSWLHKHKARTAESRDTNRNHDRLAESRSCTKQAVCSNLALLGCNWYVDTVVL